MRMRVAATHRSTLILKYLHMVDVLERTQFLVLLRPQVDNLPNVSDFHLCKCKVVPWRETDDTTQSGLTFGNQEPVLVRSAVRHVR